ncbi:hypothetical protein Scep_021876 [Stephania cephalantha]|uniref:Uncharacterized protein n=1 Tax=Stephania cephalantha TaxID=152367 RepID=A0AAP0F9S9_9MAGN
MPVSPPPFILLTPRLTAPPNLSPFPVSSDHRHRLPPREPLLRPQPPSPPPRPSTSHRSRLRRPHTSQASITASPTTTSPFPVGFDHRLSPTRRRLLSIVATSYGRTAAASTVHCRHCCVHRLLPPVPPPPPPLSPTHRRGLGATNTCRRRLRPPPVIVVARTTAAPTAASTAASNSTAALHYILPPVQPPPSPRTSHASIAASPTATSQER